MTTTETLTLLGVVLALGAAIVNWNYARVANRHAGEALELAQSAENRADRLERASYERRDVTWEATWDSDSKALVLRNVGTDTAWNVRLFVDSRVLERRRLAEKELVFGSGTISCNLADAHERARDEWENNMKVSGWIGLPAMDITARVTWTSESGVPGVQAFDDLSL